MTTEIKDKVIKRTIEVVEEVKVVKKEGDEEEEEDQQEEEDDEEKKKPKFLGLQMEKHPKHFSFVQILLAIALITKLFHILVIFLRIFFPLGILKWRTSEFLKVFFHFLIFLVLFNGIKLRF